jgi:TPP-dependent pyruvate/acetoin dehydrogenase alpha subunit
MGTALSLTESVTDLSLKAAAYGMASSVVDGMDVLAVEEAAKKAAEEIRADGRPHFLECRTYRFRAHSMFDPEFYRAKNEVEEWKNRGPIIKLTSRLKPEGIITEEDFQAADAEAAAQVAEAIAFAEAGTWEPVEDLMKFVHTERSQP